MTLLRCSGCFCCRGRLPSCWASSSAAECVCCAAVAVPAGGGTSLPAGLPHLLLSVCAALQWLFLLEGAPAVLLGFLICWRLAPDPERAAFLKPAELQWLLNRYAYCTLVCTELPMPAGTLHISMYAVSAQFSGSNGS